MVILQRDSYVSSYMYREYVLESADIYVCLGTYPLIPDDDAQIINSDPSSLVLGKYFPIVIQSHFISFVYRSDIPKHCWYITDRYREKVPYMTDTILLNASRVIRIKFLKKRITTIILSSQLQSTSPHIYFINATLQKNKKSTFLVTSNTNTDQKFRRNSIYVIAIKNFYDLSFHKQNTYSSIWSLNSNNKLRTT